MIFPFGLSVFNIIATETTGLVSCEVNPDSSFFRDALLNLYTEKTN